MSFIAVELDHKPARSRAVAKYTFLALTDALHPGHLLQQPTAHLHIKASETNALARETAPPLLPVSTKPRSPALEAALDSKRAPRSWRSVIP